MTVNGILDMGTTPIAMPEMSLPPHNRRFDVGRAEQKPQPLVYCRGR